MTRDRDAGPQEDRIHPRADPPPPWEDPRSALRRHGLRPKRRFSQSFLVARPVVERIAEAAVARQSSSTAPLVELGPGLGTLTGALLRRGRSVVAVEPDPDMRAVLAADLVDGGAPLVVVDGDATEVRLTGLVGVRAPVTVVGNLPYAVTGGIFRNLLAQADELAAAVVMVQREVRDRLLAPPGTPAYGALTVFVSARFEVAGLFLVPAGAFHPAPKVQSAVLALAPRPTPRARETPAFRTVVRAAFGQRRKTLRNALVGGAGWTGGEVDAALAAAGIEPRRRGETLTVEELAALAAAGPAARPDRGEGRSE